MKTSEEERIVPRDVPSGVAIASGSLLGVLAMTHHPSLSAHGTAAMFRQAVEMAGIIEAVHAFLVAIAALTLFGYTGFTLRLGFRSAAVRFAFVAYSLGSIAQMGAGLLNGLVFPRMAEAFVDASASQMEAAHVAMAYGTLFNQALAGAGVVAWSAAVCAWSVSLLRHPRVWRWIGAFGLLVGAGGGALYLGGHLRLDVHGFGAFLLAQSLWGFAVGAALAFAPTGRRAG